MLEGLVRTRESLSSLGVLGQFFWLSISHEAFFYLILVQSINITPCFVGRLHTTLLWALSALLDSDVRAQQFDFLPAPCWAERMNNELRGGARTNE